MLAVEDYGVTHWTHLAAVLAPLPVPGADEDVRDVLSEAGSLVHVLALRVVDDGEVDLLQHRGQRAVCRTVQSKMIAISH